MSLSRLPRVSPPDCSNAACFDRRRLRRQMFAFTTCGTDGPRSVFARATRASLLQRVHAACFDRRRLRRQMFAFTTCGTDGPRSVFARATRASLLQRVHAACFDRRRLRRQMFAFTTCGTDGPRSVFARATRASLLQRVHAACFDRRRLRRQMFAFTTCGTDGPRSVFARARVRRSYASTPPASTVVVCGVKCSHSPPVEQTGLVAYSQGRRVRRSYNASTLPASASVVGAVRHPFPYPPAMRVVLRTGTALFPAIIKHMDFSPEHKAGFDTDTMAGGGMEPVTFAPAAVAGEVVLQMDQRPA